MAQSHTEEELISRAIAAMKKGLREKYPPGETRRFFHPKMHGCLQATLEVESLPAEKAKGFFSRPGTYPVWLRFSSANPKIRDDRKKGFIGAALKIGKPGQSFESLRSGESFDILLVSKEALAAADLITIVRTVEAITGNIFKKIAFGIRYFRRIIGSLLSSTLITKVNQASYFSQTPYAFGEKTIKYALFPSIPSSGASPAGNEPDFLRHRLQDELSEKEISFDLLVQFREDNITMPLEDPSVKWNSPFHKIATLRIPVQQFDNPERDSIGENLSYNPWDCPSEHLPLGMINRARKAAYEALSEFRHERNGVPVTTDIATKEEAPRV